MTKVKHLQTGKFLSDSYRPHAENTVSQMEPSSLYSALLFTRAHREHQLTDDVVSTVRTGVVLEEPRVHTLLMEPVGTGDDPQLLLRGRRAGEEEEEETGGEEERGKKKS